ncbi:TATA element modulatory factor 1 TATA binding-domain-containing protein [Peziza echinospora]|nr:TATA element modulatory factor 1 TATA binding-domain-containing protein [Peziza echinospora]
MQERLAAAMARSASPSLNLPNAPGSARSSMDRTRPSAASSDVSAAAAAASETQPTPKEKPVDPEEAKTEEEKEEIQVSSNATESVPETTSASNDENVEDVAAKIQITPPQPEPVVSEAQKSITTAIDEPIDKIPTITTTVPASSSTPLEPAEYEAKLAQLNSDLEKCELRRQEELHASTERIDALEAKVKYLARESAEAAKHRASSSPAGGMEKKLAEKDERIALLLEEGERLSKLELKNLTIIKKLRAKVTEDEKAVAESKRKLERTEKELVDSKEKLKKAAENERRLNERVRSLGKVESEADSLRKDKISKDNLILDLRAQLSQAKTRAEEAEGKAQTEALEAEKSITRDLREQIEKIKTEATLTEEALRTEIGDLKSKIERDTDRARMTESELRSEISVLETTVEVLRARAEEVSSGASGDAHAKLLRQVEMLQTQYAIASENWQGIEGSLLSRVSAVERERDDLVKSEADIRRKARDLNLRAKRAEMDLDSANTKIREAEEDLEIQKSKTEGFQKQISELQSSLKESRIMLERAKEEFERELAQKLEDTRSKLLEEFAAQARPTSPSIGNPRFTMRSMGRSPNLSIDGYAATFSPPTHHHYNNNNNHNHHHRDISASGSIDRDAGYNGGNNSLRRSRPSFSGQRQDSAASLAQLGAGGQNSSKTSLQLRVGDSAETMAGGGGDDDQDDYFGETSTGGTPGGGNTTNSGLPTPQAYFSPSSPHARTFSHQHQHPHDLASVSTVAAGPSVQLVERMSATVRRLETEMAASRDELTRMVGQRDEARQELLNLMREVEAKREVDEMVRKLREEKEEVGRRLDAALDELGEKLDRVDELEDQMGDLKMMYKDLLIRTSGG